MKTTISLLTMLLLTSICIAQKPKKGTDPAPVTTTAPADPAKLHKDVYHNSLLSGDVTTAVIAVQYILAADPSQVAWKDTLAMLYFQRGSYESAILTTRDILARQPENQAMLEVSAVSKQSLGMAKESLEDYEKLYPLTKSWYHLYEMASLQLALKRFGECELTARGIAGSGECADLNVVIRTQMGEQSVPLNAAAWNVLGVVMTETGKHDEAKALFKKALDIKPDFALAKANLEELQRTQPDGGK